MDDAVYEYLKVLEISPETVDIHNKLGILYEKKGLKEEAKKVFCPVRKIKGEINNPEQQIKFFISLIFVSIVNFSGHFCK